MKYQVRGGKKLIGKLKISGNKNSVFPAVAAALLTEEEVVLENIPILGDTQILIQILRKLGAKVETEGSTLRIRARKIDSNSLPADLMTKLRGSIVLVGALLARENKVTFYHPGGDIIGQRSISTHLEGFKALGANLERRDLKFSLYYPQDKERTPSSEIFLQEASVSATENLILASSLGKSTVALKNCSKEPHVLDLCNLLVEMGADIKGIGTDKLVICGSEKLRGTKFRIGVDYIEVGTYAIAAAITHGQVTLEGLDSTDLDPVTGPLKRFGIKMEKDGTGLRVSSKNLKSPGRLVTNIWPGFPTDLMSVAIVLATQSSGVTLCHDWMYESRMFFVDKLISMGANITLADPHRSFVYGPTRLKARQLETPDIRAGMALVLAALSAKGESVINQAELIERGYEDVVGKLKALGADIVRSK